jgi:hypothetical protein
MTNIIVFAYFAVLSLHHQTTGKAHHLDKRTQKKTTGKAHHLDKRTQKKKTLL